MYVRRKRINGTTRSHHDYAAGMDFISKQLKGTMSGMHVSHRCRKRTNKHYCHICNTTGCKSCTTHWRGEDNDTVHCIQCANSDIPVYTVWIATQELTLDDSMMCFLQASHHLIGAGCHESPIDLPSSFQPNLSTNK